MYESFVTASLLACRIFMQKYGCVHTAFASFSRKSCAILQKRGKTWDSIFLFLWIVFQSMDVFLKTAVFYLLQGKKHVIIKGTVFDRKISFK